VDTENVTVKTNIQCWKEKLYILNITMSLQLVKTTEYFILI